MKDGQSGERMLMMFPLAVFMLMLTAWATAG
jgi:hypothetical protein